MNRTVYVLNLGAGVQSTTLYLMAIQRWLCTRVDVAIFADTGEEPQAVYRHLEWLQSLKGPPILIKSKGDRLGDTLVSGKRSSGSASHAYRFASVPVFTRGGKGRVRRQCTKEYKVEVIERSIRRDVLGLAPRRTAPRGTTVWQLAGISLDEAGRARRMKQQKRPAYLQWQFPLLDMQMTRQDCINWLAECGNVPHETPRSACVFCPYHSDAEWRAVKAVPEDWQRAVEIDEAIRSAGARCQQGMTESMYVHRSCQPLVQIDFSQPVTGRAAHINLAFNQECQGMCGV